MPSRFFYNPLLFPGSETANHRRGVVGLGQHRHHPAVGVGPEGAWG